jgi:hypothetical protein
LVTLTTDASSAIDGSGLIEGTPVEMPTELAGPLRACIHRVETSTPPELAAALESVEYTSAAEDGCRAEMAPRLRESSLCDGIVLSAVRDQCRMRVAIARGEPDTCPPSTSDRGLDPVCLALAAHEVSRCAAALPQDRTRCLAIARDDTAQCTSLDPLLQPRCRRDVNVLHGVLPRMNGAPAVAGTLHLTIAPGTSTDAEAARAWDLDAASRGAYVDSSGTLFIVDPQRGWPSPFTPTSEHPVLALSMSVPSRPGPGVLTEARIVMPDGRVLEASPALPSASVTFTRVGRVRGARIAATGRFVLSGTGAPYAVEVTFDTFVRDVIAREALE